MRLAWGKLTQQLPCLRELFQKKGKLIYPPKLAVTKKRYKNERVLVQNRFMLLFSKK